MSVATRTNQEKKYIIRFNRKLLCCTAEYECGTDFVLTTHINTYTHTQSVELVRAYTHTKPRLLSFECIIVFASLILSAICAHTRVSRVALNKHKIFYVLNKLLMTFTSVHCVISIEKKKKNKQNGNGGAISSLATAPIKMQSFNFQRNNSFGQVNRM